MAAFVVVGGGRLYQGTLEQATDPKDTTHSAYRVVWGRELELKIASHSGENVSNLSDIVRLGNAGLYTADRTTGIVHEVVLPAQDASGDPHALLVPRHVLAGADGGAVEPFRVEWLACKEGVLVVGSDGRETTAPDDGHILDKRQQWVKMIHANGRVEHTDWSAHYESLRRAVGAEFPGYLVHHAASWHPSHRRWYFLPHRLSREPYETVADRTRGATVLLAATEDFWEVKARHLAPLREQGMREGRAGFTAFRFVPAAPDVILAVRSVEVPDGGSTSTLVVFDIHGHILMSETFAASVPFTGIEFV